MKEVYVRCMWDVGARNVAREPLRQDSPKSLRSVDIKAKKSSYSCQR